MFVIPVKTDNPSRHRPFALIGIVLVCIAAFLFELLPPGLEVHVKAWGYLSDEPSLSRALQSMFLHGGFLHLLGNMFFLWMFGDSVEDVIGAPLFIVCFLVTGLVAVGAFHVLHPHLSTPLVGASGAISGILGMYVVFFPQAKADLVFYFLYWELGSVAVTSIGAIATWFGEQLLLGLLLESSGVTSVAFSAHVGGFVVGALAGMALVSSGCVERYESRSPRHPVLGHIV